MKGLKKYLAGGISVMLMATLLVGCAKPPTMEMDAAKVAMDGAVSAGAGRSRADPIIAAAANEMYLRSLIASLLSLSVTCPPAAPGPEPHPLLEELADIDPDALTPKEALDALYRLKRRLDT